MFFRHWEIFSLNFLFLTFEQCSKFGIESLTNIIDKAYEGDSWNETNSE